MKDLLQFPAVKAPAEDPAPEIKRKPRAIVASAPKPPAWLIGEPRKEWLRLAPQLAATWQEKYEDVFAVYCTQIAHFKTDPANFGVSRLAQMRGLACDLGLTPRSQRLVDN